MNRIKVAALGAAVAFGFGAQARAQQAQPQQQAPARGARGARGEGRQRDGGALFRGIDLSDTQKSQVQGVMAKYREQRQSLFPRGQQGDAQRPDSAARAERRAQMQGLMQREQTELRAVLTPAQQTQFDKNVADFRQRVQDRAQRGGRQGRGKRSVRAAGFRHGKAGGARAAFKGITLSDAQKSQLKTLRAKQQGETKALATQLRANGQKPDAAGRAKFAALREQHRAQVRAVLTPAQQQQFDANVATMKAAHAKHGKKAQQSRGA